MPQEWKPSELLVSTLTECGVDTDILNDLLNQTFESDTNQSSLILVKEFTFIAVSQQISWSDALEPTTHEDISIQPKTRMKAGWRPKDETLELLIKLLEYDRVTIGFAREYFIREYKEQISRTWDCLFIRFCFEYFEITKEQNTNQETIKQDKSIDAEPETTYPEEQRKRNQYLIRKLVEQVLKTKYVSHYFNKPLEESWQPAKWVVVKLQKKFNLNRRFIFDHTLLKPFISYYSKKDDMFVDYNVQYFYWVAKRFKTIHKLLLEQKYQLEKQLDDES